MELYSILVDFSPMLCCLPKPLFLFGSMTLLSSYMAATIYMCMAVTLQCVYVFSSHLFWTSSSLDVPAGVIHEESHTGFLIHVPSVVHAFIFLARRIHPFLSLVDREVKFCV